MQNTSLTDLTAQCTTSLQAAQKRLSEVNRLYAEAVFNNLANRAGNKLLETLRAERTQIELWMSDIRLALKEIRRRKKLAEKERLEEQFISALV